MLGYFRRGEVYRRRNELEAALRDLTRAAGLDPAAPRPLELLGDVESALHRYPEAAERYEASIGLDDQSPRVLYKLALSRYRMSQQPIAIEVLRKAVGLNERFAEAHYLLGLCLRDRGNADEALKSLKRAAELAPTMLSAAEELAELYGRLGKIEERFDQLERLMALDPSPSRGVALGVAYANHGLIDRAVPALRHTAERYPQDPYVNVALGRVWLEAAQARDDRVALGRALEALEGAVGTDDSSEALMLFGRALLLASDDELAERILTQASEQLPVDPLAFYYLAEAAERQGHAEVARKALLDYRALAGEERDARRRAVMAERLADLSFRLDDTASALLWYQRALEADSSDVSVLLRYAEAQWKAGSQDAARASVAKALEKEPNNVAARTLQRRYR
jgi:tetratricopeptide (TPR) repeat protein